MIDPLITGICVDTHRMVFLNDQIIMWGEYSDGSTTYYGKDYHIMISSNTGKKDHEDKAKKHCKDNGMDYEKLVEKYEKKKKLYDEYVPPQAQSVSTKKKNAK
jgi:hypothetical protein